VRCAHQGHGTAVALTSQRTVGGVVTARWTRGGTRRDRAPVFPTFNPRLRVKSSRKTSDKRHYATQVASNILALQISLACAVPSSISSDPFALGYVFGYHDRVLQVLGIEDAQEGLAMMAAGYRNLFGERLGSVVLSKCVDLRGHPRFEKGAFQGEEDAGLYLRARRLSMGLSSYLRIFG